jgi:hypothetical protein
MRAIDRIVPMACLRLPQPTPSALGARGGVWAEGPGVGAALSAAEHGAVGGGNGKQSGCKRE